MAGPRAGHPRRQSDDRRAVGTPIERPASRGGPTWMAGTKAGHDDLFLWLRPISLTADRPRHGALVTQAVAASRPKAEGTALAILVAISFSHLLNDMMQSMLPAIYPMLKTGFALDFAQIGLISLVWQVMASLLQPVVGVFTDRRPQPFSLAAAMAFTFIGLIVLALADSFAMLLVGSAVVGMGSSIFHPESARVARLASGGRHGFAQSLFQVGGQIGSSAGPLLAAFLVLPHGQVSLAWMSIAAVLAMVVLVNVGRWYQHKCAAAARAPAKPLLLPVTLSSRRVRGALAVLLTLIFSKYFYLASLTTFYTFYLIHRFQVSVQTAQILLFVFLTAVAIGTFAGGPLGDRFGRKYVIWGSILGVLPFTVMLPHAGLMGTTVLSVLVGLILSSAFSAIVVYGQELLPGRVGMVNGLFFGFAFGMAGLGAAAMGWLADLTDIDFVYRVFAFLPALGVLAVFLPNLDSDRPARA
jgi:FSR family fosmidomycin resistance protein-like MFS transporter